MKQPKKKDGFKEEKKFLFKTGVYSEKEARDMAKNKLKRLHWERLIK